MPIKRMGKRRVTDWDKVFRMKVGDKSQSSIPFAKDIISQFANPVQTTSYQNTNTNDNTGSWVPSNTTPSSTIPYYPHPNTYLPNTSGSSPFKWEQGYSHTVPKTEEKEKPKHDPKELMGKRVAFVTIQIHGIEYNGILFVRRCGAWKFIDCRTMNKVASGSETSPIPHIIIHYIIYADETDTKPKPKSRFDDIEMNEIKDADKDGIEI